MSKPSDAEERAVEAAEAWLALVDAGDAAAAWAEASSTFRAAVSPDAWADSLTRAYAPIGSPLERSFSSSEYHAELPGAPDGHYVIVTYDTRFEHRRRGTETVVPQMDTDGCWRVSGYWVK